MEYWVAFGLGLVGSLHCAGMCGPLLLALAKSRPRTRSSTPGRLFYHLGRVLAYCGLGMLMGSLGHLAAPAGFQRWLSIAVGLVLLTTLLAATRISLTAPILHWIGWLKHAMRATLQGHSIAAQAALGALNGLLPCGLVYTAAAGATATGHPLSGAVYMALFGLGTWPMMLGIHFIGLRLPLPSWLSLGKITRLAVLCMALLLILRGLELGIPFLSPELSAADGSNSRCH